MIECCEPATKIRTNLPWHNSRQPGRLQTQLLLGGIEEVFEGDPATE